MSTFGDNYDIQSVMDNPSIKLDVNAELFESISSLMGAAMDSAGINVRDAQTANMFHYNKSGSREDVDPPYVGRTYVFFTRPDLNLIRANISMHPDFKYFMNTKIGRQIMPLLTTPERMINASLKTTTREIQDRASAIDKSMKELGKELEKVSDSATESDKIIAKRQDEIKKTLVENTFSGKDGNTGTSQNIFQRLTRSIISYDDLFKSDIDKDQELDQSYHVLRQDLLEAADYGDYDSYPAHVIPFSPIKKFYSRFNTLLCNTCVQVPAPNDYSVDVYETQPDFHLRNMVFAKGADAFNSPIELSLEFENMENNSVWILFYLWVRYIHCISRGEMFPRIEFSLEKMIDYFCTIFVFVTGRDGMTIKNWARYGMCYPVNIGLGGIAHSKEPSIDAWRNITIPFKCNHVRVMDPLDLSDFNQFSRQEWSIESKTADDLQKLLSHKGFFTKWRAKNKMNYSNMFKERSLDKIGDSGQLPERMLSSKRYDDIMYQSSRGYDDESGSTSRIGIDMNNKYGGFPYIVDGNKLTFIDPHTFNELYYDSVMGDEY